ncbi:MAG: LCP family protein, partial [Chloroflexota bacterium]
MRLPPSQSPRPSGRFASCLLLLILLLAGGTAAGLGYLAYVQPVAAAVSDSTGQVVPRPAQRAAVPAPTPAGLSGHRRVNVLLLGSDTDPKFNGVYDTQIMIVVSIDPASGRVAMLSIPRDLWVPIPGFGTGKIGTAYHDGGLSLARQTIEQNLGITTDYYAWIGLNGFIKVIDSLGGVTLDVMHPVIDNQYPDDVGSANPYAYRRLYIPAGPQHLDGTRALEYVRSRHGDLLGDFGRSARQQQLLEALKRQTGGRDLVAKLPSIAADLNGYLKTDMTPLQLARFAAFADSIHTSQVKRLELTPPIYTSEGTSADGQSIVIPNWPAIHRLVRRTFGPGRT